MAITVTQFDATIPADTPFETTVTVDVPFPASQVNKIRWRVPPGPRGNFGWCLSMGGVQVVPSDVGTFIVADDESDDWEIDSLPDSGAWQVTGYNTGTFDHTVYLTFFTTPNVLAATTSVGDVSSGFPQSDVDVTTMWLDSLTSVS